MIQIMSDRIIIGRKEAMSEVAEVIRKAFAEQHPWGPDLPYSFGEYVARIAPVAAQAITLIDAEKIDRLRDEITLLRRLLSQLADPDDCWFDHHGGCQAHGFLDLEPGQVCPNQLARDLLAG